MDYLKKIEYNSPVILTFALISTVVFLLDLILPMTLINEYFVYWGGFMPMDILRMILASFGHGSMEHLLGNMTLLLLIGPMLEEKFSSKVIIVLMLITALVTGAAHTLLFENGILGASGIVFMLIVLTSFTNTKSGKVPLTFILICALYLSKEVYNGLAVNNNVSELSHILGACVGIGYKFIWGRKKMHSKA